MGAVRATLYLCAWSAKKCNKACRELYDRLVLNGKAKQQALIAVAHKLLKQAFAIATKNEYYAEQELINAIRKLETDPIPSMRIFHKEWNIGSLPKTCEYSFIHRNWSKWNLEKHLWPIVGEQRLKQ